MELNITKPRKIVFSIEIANVALHDIKGTFTIDLNNSLNVGVSTIDENGKLAVNIPPLDKFPFEDGKEYEAKLCIVANDDYYTIPWTKKIIVKKPVEIKTSVKKVSESSDEPYVLVTKPIVIG